MADIAAVATVNFDELQQAFNEAPRETHTFVKQEMNRFGKRFRRQFIAKWLHGRPGIEGGQFTKGKHVRGFATGQDLGELRTVLKLSRILAVHARGAVITPKAGPWLYLSKKMGRTGTGRSAGLIFARVKSVTIPARLPFEAEAQAAIQTDLLPKIHAAMGRALRVAMERRMKALSSAVRLVTHA